MSKDYKYFYPTQICTNESEIILRYLIDIYDLSRLVNKFKKNWLLTPATLVLLPSPLDTFLVV